MSEEAPPGPSKSVSDPTGPDALVSAMRSTAAGEPQLDPWYEELKTKGEIRHLIRYEEHKFAVFLDKVLHVDWETDTTFQVPTRVVGLVSNDVALLQATPIDDLPEVLRLNFRVMLGEAMTRGLEGDRRSASSILHSAESFIRSRAAEHARVWYLEGAGAVALAALLVALPGGLLVAWIADRIGTHIDLPNFVVVSTFGAIGALLSILLRMGAAQLAPDAGRRLHQIEGGSRVLAGILGALVAHVAVFSGLVMPDLASRAGVGLVSLLAGSSERFVRGILERVPGVDPEDRPVVSSDPEAAIDA